MSLPRSETVLQKISRDQPATIHRPHKALFRDLFKFSIGLTMRGLHRLTSDNAGNVICPQDSKFDSWLWDCLMCS